MNLSFDKKSNNFYQTQNKFLQNNNASGRYNLNPFFKEEKLYHISEHDLQDLTPLVDGLIGAYVEQKKVCDQ